MQGLQYGSVLVLSIFTCCGGGGGGGGFQYTCTCIQLTSQYVTSLGSCRASVRVWSATYT